MLRNSSALRPVPPSGRSAFIVNLDTRTPPADVVVPAAKSEVVAIVHHDGAAIGQQWLRVPRDGIVRADTLWGVIQGYAWPIAVRSTRDRVAAALGAPLGPSTRPLSVAVVICTKDRSEQLRACIGSVQRLNREVELLVVDNNSSDDRTKQVCAELGVRCVDEPTPGQTSARNRGFAETTTDLVAFTDDDVTVDPDWLDDIDQAFADPLVMIATGYIGPRELDHHDQVQFEAHGGFERHAMRRVFDGCVEPTMLAAGVVGAGANMVIRREAIARVGWFDVEFGPGSPVRTADDKVYFYRVLQAGFRIEHDPSRRVWHQHRADRAALLRIMRDYGTGEFSWTSHIMRRYKDPAAPQIWRWWLGHFVKDVKRNRSNTAAGVSLDMTASEIKGAFEAAGALRKAARARLTLPGPPDHLPPAPPAPSAAIVAEAPPITVAIISHQRRDSLRRALEHVARQTVPGERFEVVVVLDGCSDGSAEMLASIDFGIEVRAESHEHLGVSAARNRTFEMATNPVVAMLDDDIDVAPDWLAALGACHARHTPDTWVFANHPADPPAGFAGQETRRWWNDHLRRKSEPDHRWTMLDMVAGNSSISAARFKELGGFDPLFRARYEDYDLGWRHLEAGGQCAFAADARAVHRARASFEAQLRVAEAEGRDGIALLSKHPAALGQLPMADPELMRVARKRRVVASVGGARFLPVIAAMEKLQRRRDVNRLFGLLWVDAYRRGVERGLAEFGLKAVPPPPIPERVKVDLAPGAAPAVVPDDVHGVALDFVLDGRVLCSIPAVGPGRQWSWEEIVERSADQVTLPLQLVATLS